MLARSRMSNVRWLTLLPMVMLGLLTGCIKQTINGGEATYSNELWVGLLMVVGGIALTPLGWLLRNKSQRLGWMLMFLGVFLAAGWGPSMFTEKVIVNDTHLYVKSGTLWFMPEVHDVNFDDVQSMRLISETTRGRRGRITTKYYYVFDTKSGTPQKVQFDTAMMKAANPRIFEQVNKRGIPVVDMLPQE